MRTELAIFLFRIRIRFKLISFLNLNACFWILFSLVLMYSLYHCTIARRQLDKPHSVQVFLGIDS